MPFSNRSCTRRYLFIRTEPIFQSETYYMTLNDQKQRGKCCLKETPPYYSFFPLSQPSTPPTLALPSVTLFVFWLLDSWFAAHMAPCKQLRLLHLRIVLLPFFPQILPPQQCFVVGLTERPAENPPKFCKPLRFS